MQHIARVRTIPQLQHATCVLLLESNLACVPRLEPGSGLTADVLCVSLLGSHRFESQHILHYISEQNVAKWVALSEGAGGALGRLTTHERKEAMCFQLRDCLKVGNIFLHADFFSVQLDDREAVKIIRDELTRFAIVVEPAKTLFGKVRRTYTGKIGGQNDDLAMTLQLAVSGIRCFYQNPKVCRCEVQPLPTKPTKPTPLNRPRPNPRVAVRPIPALPLEAPSRAQLARRQRLSHRALQLSSGRGRLGKLLCLAFQLIRSF